MNNSFNCYLYYKMNRQLKNYEEYPLNIIKNRKSFKTFGTGRHSKTFKVHVAPNFDKYNEVQH